MSREAFERAARPQPYDYSAYLASPVFRLSRSMAMERTGGRCTCGARATEVHHASGYPPWGTFDLPSALTPICHACHCREHGKDR